MEQLQKYMIFVDGSNFLKQLGKEIGEEFSAAHPPDDAIELCADLIKYLMRPTSERTIRHGSERKIRHYWFGSYDERKDINLEEKLTKLLRKLEFEPRLFKKVNKKEKGVDIALTKEMLVNAFNGNFDIGYLVAGDGDYVDLVYEVKRYGPIIDGAFLDRKPGLARELKMAFDYFQSLNFWFDKKLAGEVIYESIQNRISTIRKQIAEQKKQDHA